MKLKKKCAGACRNFSHPTLYCKKLFLFVLIGYTTRMKIPNVLHLQWCAVPTISKIQLCFSALHKISKRGNKNEKGESHVKRLQNVNHLSSRLINFQAYPVYELMFWQRGKTYNRGVSRLFCVFTT